MAKSLEEGTSLCSPSLSLARAIPKERSKLYHNKSVSQWHCTHVNQVVLPRIRMIEEGGGRGSQREGRNRLPSLWSSSSERDWQMNDSTERRLDNDHT